MNEDKKEPQLEPIPLIKMLVILVGFAAGFSTVLYIAYLIMAVLK